MKSTWFALCSNGNLEPLGNHINYTAADAAATDLGLEVIWLIDRKTAAQWADTISTHS